ncbi:DUF6635 family protein [Agaribacterium sp. ZY112]|uniref:DUF6635 family protein n=1 Tax=Agaribacterium sp. ZY112 TaxID=3233574 RepID=UPI003525EC4E
MHQINPQEQQNLAINHAITGGISDYFESLEKQLDIFVKREFLYPGCWRNNKVAFGWDLIKAPLNLFWAPFYLLILCLLGLAKYCGLSSAGRLAKALPSGFYTQVQKQLNRKFKHTLYNKAELQRSIVARLEAISGTAKMLEPAAQAELEQQLERIINDTLEQLILSRTAHADIGNSLISTAIGALAFKKFSPGGIGLGLLLAAYWARRQAESEFWLGQTAGKLYYWLFPPQAELSIQLSATAIVLLLLAVFASFSGLISDPILALTGSHKRRLLRIQKQVKRDLLQRCNSRYRSLDPYIARILELFDSIKAQLPI